MTIFKRDSENDRYPSFYVLDPDGQEAIAGELDRLQASMKRFTLDLRTIDWKLLSSQLRELRTGPPPAGEPPGQRGEDPAMALVPIAGPAPALHGPARHASAAAFVEAASAIVHGSRDPRLTASWKQLAQQLQQAPAERGAAIDYFAWFFPDLREIAREPHVLRRIFDALAAALSRLFSTASSSLASVWEIARDPDPYFLRLRGEVTEWARRNQAAPIADQLLFVPDVFRLYVRLLADRRVAVRGKAELVAALAYLIWPFDVLPEGIIGPAGYLDDAFVLLKALTGFVDAKNVHPDVLGEHWSGSPESLDRLLGWAAFCESRLPWFSTVATWWEAR